MCVRVCVCVCVCVRWRSRTRCCAAQRGTELDMIVKWMWFRSWRNERNKGGVAYSYSTQHTNATRAQQHKDKTVAHAKGKT